MARIRSVHPDICRDDVLAECSASAERTFVRLWCHLDDDGRTLDNPKLIAADLYPLHDEMDADAVDRDLDELAALGLLIRYVVKGRRYLSAKPEAWRSFQKPRHPTPSKLPSPEEADGTTPAGSGNPTADRRNAPAGVGVGVGVGVGDGGGEERDVEPASPPSTALALVTDPQPEPDPVVVVFDAWREATRRDRAKLTSDRRKRIRNWLKEYPLDDLADACRGITLSEFHAGRNDRHTRYDGIEHALKSAQHIEQFRDLWRDGPEPTARPQPKSADTIRRLAQGGDL